MRLLRNVVIAYGVLGGLAISGPASAARLHLQHGVRFQERGLRLHEPGPHLQQYGICGVLSGHPCHPAFCSVFQRGPCLPYYLPPLGETLQLTITTTDDNDPATLGDTNPDGADQAGEKPLDTIGQMFAALRACWVPPPKIEARHGMQYTVRFAFKRDGEMVAPPFVTYASHDAPADTRNVYRDAVEETLDRCTPLHFTGGMAEAVAGRPIAVRFVDNRTIGKSVQ
jgi:hypothetical protein